MKIVNVEISKLKAYENNPRRISDSAIEAVANSIKDFGFKVPCVITADNVIVTGHTRVQAAQKLGLKEVPCIIADDLTPEQIKAFRLVDNKTSELSVWDFEKLDLELEELPDFDMSSFGFEEYQGFDDFISDMQNNGMANSAKNPDPKFFSVTFTIEQEYKSRFDDYIKEHGKDDLKNILIGAVIDNA